MDSFTPVASAVGGVLIGLAAALVMLLLGRVAGISSILSGLLGAAPGERRWKIAFLVGLIGAGPLLVSIDPSFFAVTIDRSTASLLVAGLLVAGLLVGFGTRLGGGCTSGHGVCGLGRLSGRSLAATLTFMAVGMLTAGAVTHLFDGRL